MWSAHGWFAPSSGRRHRTGGARRVGAVGHRRRDGGRGGVGVDQPLRGHVALLHLACMRLLAESVPQELAATAQAIYGTVGVGAATACATGSGWLYARMGAAAFGVMSLLCLVALPAARLRG